MVFDGVNWDRMRGDQSFGVKVQGSGAAWSGADGVTLANTAFGASGDLGANAKGATLGISNSGATPLAQTVTVEAAFDAPGSLFYKMAEIAFGAGAASTTIRLDLARHYRLKSSINQTSTSTIAWNALVNY